MSAPSYPHPIIAREGWSFIAVAFAVILENGGGAVLSAADGRVVAAEACPAIRMLVCRNGESCGTKHLA